MVSTIVYATDNEDGGNCNGGGRGNCNGGDSRDNSSEGGNRNGGSSNGNQNGSNDGNGRGFDGNNGNGGIWKGDEGLNRKDNGNDNGGRGDVNGNERNFVDMAYHNQKSDVGSKTPVIQHRISMPVQVSVVVLLVTYPAVATVGLADGPGWWGVLESNTERLFRKFFFLVGSVGEKIRRKNVLRNEKRREIYYFIVNNPFSHFRRITRMARVGPNQGSWHLRILERMGLIRSEHVGRYLTYHANNTNYVGTRDNRPAAIIQNNNATKILEYLLSNPGVNVAHLSQALMMNRNTISYHIKRMQTSGLVERVGRNCLRLSPIGNDHRDRLKYLNANHTASRIEAAITTQQVL